MEAINARPLIGRVKAGGSEVGVSSVFPLLQPQRRGGSFKVYKLIMLVIFLLPLLKLSLLSTDTISLSKNKTSEEKKVYSQHFSNVFLTSFICRFIATKSSESVIFNFLKIILSKMSAALRFFHI